MPVHYILKPTDLEDVRVFLASDVCGWKSTSLLPHVTQISVDVTSVLSCQVKFFSFQNRNEGLNNAPSSYTLTKACHLREGAGWSPKTPKHGLLRFRGWLGIGSSRRTEHECQEKVGTVSKPQKHRGCGLDGCGRGHGLYVPRDKELRSVKKTHYTGAGGLAGPLHRRHSGEAAVHPDGRGEERHRGGSSACNRCVGVIWNFYLFKKNAHFTGIST